MKANARTRAERLRLARPNDARNFRLLVANMADAVQVMATPLRLL